MQKYKLGYFKSPINNVGDDLNEWLWPKLLGTERFVENSENVFIGIGSVLDKRWDDFGSKLVFGTGARDSKTIPEIDSTFDVRFVRGPLTKNALSKSFNAKAITDPAILISDFFKKEKSSSQIGYIPYFRADLTHWHSLCSELGFNLISPLNSVEQFSSEIAACKLVITEAMHGAIFADSLRIPWYPVSQITRSYENSTHIFKWTDWTGSMELEFREKKLPVVWPNDSPLKKSLKSWYIKSALKKVKLKDCFLSDEALFIKRKQEIWAEIAKLNKSTLSI